MGRREFGNVRKLRSGRWQAAYWADGVRHAAPRTFATKSDATTWLTTVEADMHRGEWINPLLGQTLMRDWVARWEATIIDLRPSTLARDLDYTARYIVPVFGDCALGDISVTDVRAWIAKLVALGLAPATVTKAGQILSKIMRSAMEAGLIRSNPCANVKMPRIERHEMRYLTPAEVARLADAIAPRYRAVVILGAYGGLRAGELFGLKAVRLNLLHRSVAIAEQIVEVSGTLHVGPPKTRAGRRTVPLPRIAVDALAEHLAHYGGTELVFTTPSGSPVRLASWRQRVWLPAIDKAGVAPFRIHDLRHTAVALWIAAGASPREIANRAGHSSVSVVLDRYGHLLPGTEERVNDALDALARATAEVPIDESPGTDRARGAREMTSAIAEIGRSASRPGRTQWAVVFLIRTSLTCDSDLTHWPYDPSSHLWHALSVHRMVLEPEQELLLVEAYQPPPRVDRVHCRRFRKLPTLDH